MEFKSLPQQIQVIAAHLLSDRMQFSTQLCETKSPVAMAQEIREAFTTLYSPFITLKADEREKLATGVFEVFCAIDKSLCETTRGTSIDDVRKILQIATDAANKHDGTRLNVDAICGYLATAKIE
ncbi:TPA: hypothetical protein U1T22_000495 [Escherichia coli]|nr:hypothetical protein [Escherichia coli]